MKVINTQLNYKYLKDTNTYSNSFIKNWYTDNIDRNVYLLYATEKKNVLFARSLFEYLKNVYYVSSKAV